MAKICMISVDHSPLDDRIFFKEALSLKSAGHQITQVCRADSSGVMYDMGGKKALNQPHKPFHYNDITSYPISSNKSFAQNLLSKFFVGKFEKEFIKKAIALQADVYHAHEPISFYFGLKIVKETNSKLVFDSHESYITGTPKERYILKFHIPKLRFLITANQLTRGYLNALIPQINSLVIYNAAEERLFSSSVKPNPNTIIFTHDGYLPFNRGLVEMVKAFHLVYQKYPHTRLKFIGSTEGEEKRFLEEFISQNKLENVITQTGWLDYQQVGTELKKCNIGIIAKKPTINNTIGGPPIKYFNYTAAGLAIIDVGMPETKRLINKYQNGIIAANSIDGLAKKMIQLVKDQNLLLQLQENSKFAFKELNWKNESKKLVHFYENEVLGQKKGL